MTYIDVAPLLGFADAFLPTIDREELRGVVNDAGTLLLFVLRAKPAFFGTLGVPEAPHLSKDDHNRIKGFVHLETPQAVEDFKLWIANVPDPDGAIARWWKQKLMHFWLLPAKIQCLSRMIGTRCLQQRIWVRHNAACTQQRRYTNGYDRIVQKLVHRYASSIRRHAAAADKGMGARDADEGVIALRQAKVQVETELKRAVAESKGVHRRARKWKKLLMERYDNYSRRTGSTPPSRSAEKARVDHREDEHDDAQREIANGRRSQWSDTSQRRLRSRWANVSFTTSTRDTAPFAAKRKLTLTAAAPAPKSKRREAGDPLAGRAIELVPGDRRRRNPTKDACPHRDPINLTKPNPDPTKIEQGSLWARFLPVPKEKARSVLRGQGLTVREVANLLAWAHRTNPMRKNTLCEEELSLRRPESSVKLLKVISGFGIREEQ
ncbi:hypothetical protein B0H19DRAFT_1081054 [Mycena capillaripes]|nr:hypothetical protein B0H19DRAFT_1081054 [Mycena capillaripes]